MNKVVDGVPGIKERCKIVLSLGGFIFKGVHFSCLTKYFNVMIISLKLSGASRTTHNMKSKQNMNHSPLSVLFCLKLRLKDALQ